MRSLTLSTLAFATLLFGACASPLDEPLGQREAALAPFGADGYLPACDDYDLSGDAGILVYDAGEGLYVVTAGGKPLCAGNADSLKAAGWDPDAIDVIDANPPSIAGGETDPDQDGTPLPARTADGTSQDGTPLPAGK